MTSQTVNKQIKAPILRRIFKKGSLFTCGICRSSYSSRVDANNCLNHCWYEIKEQYPLLLVPRPFQKHRYRCHFCFRTYKTEDGGLLCADQCVEKAEEQHIMEQLSNDLPIEVTPKRRFRLVRLDPVAIQKKALEESLAPEPEPVVEENIEEELPAEAPPVKRHKKEFPKQWVRQDAKYQCRFCLELYFTKMEVEACFKGHFDEDGYEIL